MALKTSFQKAEDSPGFMLWKASNLLQRLHTQCLTDLDITPTQFSLMTCLVYLHQSGPVTASRIVDFAGMDKMMVSDLLKTLEKKELLKKRPNPNDKRSQWVEPTAHGTKVTNSAILKVEAVDTAFFKAVTNLPNFHRNLLALVEKNPES